MVEGRSVTQLWLKGEVLKRWASCAVSNIISVTACVTREAP